jgi:hypothetical protein
MKRLIVNLSLLVGILVSGMPVYAADDYCSCVPKNIAVFNNRFHVVCHEGWTAYPSCSSNKYYAGPITSTNTAWVAATTNALSMSMASSTSWQGDKVRLLVARIQYDNAYGSGVAFGCLAKDCYKILGVSVDYKY